MRTRNPDAAASRCGLFLESGEAAGRGSKEMGNSADLAAAGESVLREFLESSGWAYGPPKALKNTPGRIPGEQKGNVRRVFQRSPPPFFSSLRVIDPPKIGVDLARSHVLQEASDFLQVTALP